MSKQSVEIPFSDKERIEASVASERSKIYAAERLAPLFEVSVTLKIFGRVIFEWHFPPQSK